MQTFHLYSDGNYFPRAKKSGFGGYILDSNNEVIIEYTEQIKQPEYAYSFELLGIIRGLEIAKLRGIESIVSHCDDKNTAFKLKEIFEDNIFSVTDAMKPELFKEIVELSKDFKKIKFEYIPRAQNKHADSLSRRYSTLMEQNFLKQYDKELDNSDRNLERNTIPKKRMYFSHPTIVRNSHKNNPFLVAQHRNKRVRRVSKDEQKLIYRYIFTEIYKTDSNTTLKTSLYSEDKKLIKKEEFDFDKNKSLLENYCQVLSHVILKNNLNENIWIDTNYRQINGFFEQKEKLNNDDIPAFRMVHKSLSRFKRTFFHFLPFDHEYSIENKETEKRKKDIDENLLSLETLMDNLENGAIGKEKNRCFGAIIRHQLKAFQSSLQREMDEIEKNQIIQETVKELNDKGYTTTIKF